MPLSVGCILDKNYDCLFDAQDVPLSGTTSEAFWNVFICSSMISCLAGINVFYVLLVLICVVDVSYVFQIDLFKCSMFY